MRALIPILLLISCTPSIEKMERHDKSMTDSAMSVLDGLTSTVDTVSIVKTRTIEKTNTIEKIKYVEVEVESSPVLAMARPMPMPLIERRRCDTVFIRDTVWISR